MQNFNRQHKSSGDPEELLLREQESGQLIAELIGDNTELFDDPSVRLEFLGQQTPLQFQEITTHINRRLRGFDDSDLRNEAPDKGGNLPMLHTPESNLKSAALQKGFEAIKEYIQDSPNPHLEKVAAATEALIIWVHPFDDANGRTSRFLAQFIESGASDKSRLLAVTSDKKNRLRNYIPDIQSKQALQVMTKDAVTIPEAPVKREPGLIYLDIDFILDDNEIEEMREQALAAPDDPDAIYLSIQKLLNSDRSYKL